MNLPITDRPILQLKAATAPESPHVYVYVACLAAYSTGHLHGTWIEILPHSTVADLQTQIDAMLIRSPVPNAREWAIHDYQGWQGIAIDEQTPLTRLIELAEMIREHQQAFTAFCNYYGRGATPDHFHDRYIGKYRSEADFAQTLWEQQGKMQALEQLEILFSYIDWDAVATDLFVNYYHAITTQEGEVYVFVR